MLEPILDRFVPLERITIFTPLGIRFWDAAQDRQVADGLIVTAQPLIAPTQVTPSIRTMSGNYAFHGLPGLHAVEYPGGGASTAPLSPPAATTILIQVTDEQHRFLPVAFEVDVPYLGLFPTASPASPPGRKPPPGFYLFSAPTRPITRALAVVRAQIVDLTTKQGPAAHALIEVEGPGQNTYYGLADERGSAAVLFPYPGFATPLGGSPPPSPEAAIDRQRWDLVVRVHYSPASLRFPPGSRLPELRSVLSQPAATIWSTLAAEPGGPVGQRTFELVFGQELVMRTGTGSTLVVSPAASPP